MGTAKLNIKAEKGTVPISSLSQRQTPVCSIPERLAAFGKLNPNVVAQAREMVHSLTALEGCSEMVGIEIEAEGVPNADDMAYGMWNMHSDGSLRNHGAEFSSTPIKAHYAPLALALAKVLLPENVQFTHRTSIHVHLNMCDVDVNTVWSMALAYLPLEKFFFKVAGSQRANSIFCVPMSETRDLEHVFSITNSRVYLEKYSAVNFRPLIGGPDHPRFGTIEFRHMEGNLDLPRLVLWIQMIVALKTFAKAVKPDELVEIIAGLNTTSQYREFVERVLGYSLAEQLLAGLDYNQLRAAMERNVTQVKQCLFFNGFHNAQAKMPADPDSRFVKGLRRLFGDFSIQSSTKSSAAMVDMILAGDLQPVNWWNSTNAFEATSAGGAVPMPVNFFDDPVPAPEEDHEDEDNQ